jgi:quinol monooxygenase YgiN
MLPRSPPKRRCLRSTRGQGRLRDRHDPQKEGPSRFAIFDTFDDEAGREAHLNGKIAAALMEKAKAGDLFERTPEIHKIEILADKLPGK